MKRFIELYGKRSILFSKVILLMVIQLACVNSSGETAIKLNEPGDLDFGRSSYIQFQYGNLPIIIAASYGGTPRPQEITDSTSGIFVRDTNTEELARIISEEIHRNTG